MPRAILWGLFGKCPPKSGQEAGEKLVSGELVGKCPPESAQEVGEKLVFGELFGK